MAQDTVYQPAGSLEVKAGESYNSTNIPTETTVVQLNMGVQIKDAEGRNTPLRGVRVTIQNNLPLPLDPKSNIPFIWLEGTIIAFSADYTYTFIDNGTVGYGKPIPI